MKWALPAADTYFAKHMTERGFEVDHLDRALEHVTSFRTAIDGGAHVGSWAVAMAQRFTCVHAFEPAQDTFACLVKNTVDVPNVRVWNLALGASQMKVRIGDDLTRQGNTGARFVQDGDQTSMIRIDDLTLPDVDLLKLDIESYEYFALLGAVDTMMRCKPIVVIEEKDFKQRFGLPRTAASDFLKTLGAKEIGRVRNDCIFAFR